VTHITGIANLGSHGSRAESNEWRAFAAQPRAHRKSGTINPTCAPIGIMDAAANDAANTRLAQFIES
jgi:hypothetical protein